MVLARQAGAITLAAESISGPSWQATRTARVTDNEPLLVHFDGLPGDASFRISWQYRTADGLATGATQGFSVTPTAGLAVPVRFAFGADLGGQNVCRDKRRGYPVFDVMASYKPNFFVALGDIIYADGVCEATGLYGNAQVPGDFGRATDPAGFRAHWNYQLADPAVAAFRARVPWYATWDDHEVLNDFDPTRDFYSDEPGRRLARDARAAMKAFSGIPAAVEPLYRRIRWGKHLDLFLLDTRSYREPNATPDMRSGDPKTLLGHAQRKWLIDGISSSDATWKIVASSVPISIPTGNAQPEARDGWADGDTDTGFERELFTIIIALEEAGVENLVFISADVHFAAAFRYTLPESEFRFEEFVVGPLNAGVYPSDTYDVSLQPQRLFFYGPPDNDPIESFAEALRWFNFGLIDIDADGTLRTRIVTARGDEVYELRKTP